MEISLRHPEKGAAERAAKVATVPVMQEMVNTTQALDIQSMKN